MPVISVTGDEQENAAGQLSNVVVTVFTVTRPDGSAAGPFTVTVADNTDAVNETGALIEAKVAQVNGIYGLNP